MIKMVTRPISFSVGPNTKRIKSGEWTKEEVMYILKHFTRKSSYAWAGLRHVLENSGGYVSRHDIDEWCKEYGYKVSKDGMIRMQLWHAYKKEDLISCAKRYLKRTFKDVKMLNRGVCIFNDPVLIASKAAEAFARSFDKDDWKSTTERDEQPLINVLCEVFDSKKHFVYVDDVAVAIAKYVSIKENFWVFDEGNTTEWDWMSFKGKL